MLKKSEEAAKIAKKILLFPEQDASTDLVKLEKINLVETPSLTVILYELNGLDNDAKAALTDYAKHLPFAKSVVDVIVRHRIINIEGAGWNAYRNGVIKLSFVLYKYFSVSHIRDFTLEKWQVLREAVICESNCWRFESASIRNAIRTFVKTVNASQSEFTFVLKAYSSKSGRARSHQQLQIEYLVTKGQYFKSWQALFEEWRNNQLLKNGKSINASMALFLKFLIDNKLDIPPSQFVMISKKPSFWSFLKNSSRDVKVETIRSHALRMYEFIDWIIRDKLSEHESSDLLPLATPLLPMDIYHYVSSFTVESFRGKAENVKAILPVKYLRLIRQILTDNDHEWPRSLGWNYGVLKNQDTGDVEKVWCPHLAYLYLFMLEVPVRKMQVLCLDSGEGDDSEWVNRKWHPNSSNHAGYWSKNYGDKLGRGVVRKAYESGNECTAIYINTNKTQDREKGFSVTSGYTINWHNDSLLKLISCMREWQRKYNPVRGPVRYKDLPENIFSDSPTEAVLKLIPDRFYLFRYPLNQSTSPNYLAAPPADYLTFRFWHLLMAELERRLNEMGEDVVITTGWTANLPSKSIFTPHSLRGSGLTALAEAGVPIEVLSKVVAGHASVLMTLGYIKYNNAYISNVLDDARLKLEQSEQENYTDYLKNATWDDAYRYAVLNESFDKSEWSACQATHLFENRQIGICPNSGTRCHEGGKPVKRNGKGKSLYGPVPGGNGNCVRCRFLMTGLPFLVPLWLKANKDLADAQGVSVDVEASSNELELLRSKRFSISNEQGPLHIPASLRAEIKQVEARLDAKSANLNELLLNAHATYNLVEKVKVLRNEENSRLPALFDDDDHENDSSEFHEVSLFRQRDFIVQASRLYPHIKDDKLEMERNHFIDQVMFNMDMTPITLSALTKEEKEAACDSAADFLNAKLSDCEMKMLESGSIDIKELGIIEPYAQKLSFEVDSTKKKSQ